MCDGVCGTGSVALGVWDEVSETGCVGRGLWGGGMGRGVSDGVCGTACMRRGV